MKSYVPAFLMQIFSDPVCYIFKGHAVAQVKEDIHAFCYQCRQARCCFTFAEGYLAPLVIVQPELRLNDGIVGCCGGLSW